MRLVKFVIIFLAVDQFPVLVFHTRLATEVAPLVVADRGLRRVNTRPQTTSPRVDTRSNCLDGLLRIIIVGHTYYRQRQRRQRRGIMRMNSNEQKL